MMTNSTAVDRMLEAMRQYRIDQPDSYTVAIYGPDGFYELHDSFAEAFERKEKLAMLAALRAIMNPSKAMVDAGERAMASGQAKQVWQTLLDTIIAEHETADDRADERLGERKKALASSI